MSRTLLVIALLIPLGCRGEFDIDKYLVDEAGTEAEGSDSETGSSSCSNEQVELGSGCFGQRGVIEGLTDPFDLALAEFANAGQLDLLVSGPVFNFFLGSAGGQLGAAVPLDLGGEGIAIGRLDGDGLVDFAAIGVDVTGLRRATGGGGFSGDLGTLPVGGWDGVFADLDADGDDDLVISGDALHIVLFPDTANVVTLPVAGQGIALADVNDDGALDLAIAGTGEDTVHLLANDGAGGFSVEGTYPISQVYDVGFWDLDDDGRPELLAVDSNNGNVAVIAVQPNFSTQPRSVHAVGRVPRRLAIGDVDGDGIADVVTANRVDGDLSILLGDGSSLREEVRVPAVDGGDQYEAVVVADLDGGGRGEVIVSAPGTGRVRVFGFLE